MNNSAKMIICVLIFFCVDYSHGVFNPNLNDYDAYGSKIAMNQLFLIGVQNSIYSPTFFVQFGPYNDTEALQCYISFPNTTDHYVYTVSVGKNQTQFFFAGELMNGRNGTFIGVAKYNSTSYTCDTSFSSSLQYYHYEHQEYFVIGVESKGRFAYGFSNRFICMFDSQNTSINQSWNGNLTWPDDSFIPHAVELTDNFGIITGFILNPTNTKAKYIPIIYLMNFNSTNSRPIVVAVYEPNATSGTWQAVLSNSDADIYSAKYDMSISINKSGSVLVGMQFINRVFLFSVNITVPNRLNYVSRNTNGRTLGNGKSIAWLDNGIAAVLVNTYSLTYQWASSQIYFYDIQTYGYNSNSTPISAFPNTHQLLPNSFSSIILNIVSSSSSSSLALLDSEGNILIINPTQPGFYPFVDETGSIPVYTSPQPCLAGTYKNQIGIYDCSLCPTGTRNPGNSSLQCIPCSSESFCSLGAVDEIPHSALETTVQIRAYPKSPESTIFDEILIQNMFYIESGRCLLISPLFWTLIVAGLAIVMIIIMGVLQICINHPRSKIIRYRLKCSFKHIDLIGEGELWLGGLASVAVVVLVSFAYSFSNKFLQQYPIEETSNSYFACDTSLRNAKFDTNVQSLSIPVTEAEQHMFELLNNQTFFINVDFVNTLMDCDVISLQALYGTKWSTIRWTSCGNTNSILSLSIELPYQHISVQVLLADVQTIGGLRIGLFASGYEGESYNLNEFNFNQSFSKSGQLLAQSLPVILDVTKVVNETSAMLGEESEFSGIYIPTFITDQNSLFVTGDQYVRSMSVSTTLTIELHETPYYVKNVQQPIAKRSEIIFHNLLFTIVCLEIFGLIFLLYKLFLKPLFHLCFPKYFLKHKKKTSKKGTDHEETNRMESYF